MREKDIEDFEIDDEYNDLVESGVVMSFDYDDWFGRETLEGLDAQLSEYGLEITFWENGSALEWMIKPKTQAE